MRLKLLDLNTHIVKLTAHIDVMRLRRARRVDNTVECTVPDPGVLTCTTRRELPKKE